MTEDLDPVETREWLDLLDGVIEVEGPQRAHYLLEKLIGGARRRGAPVPYSATTPYLNTIPVEKQPHHPGDRTIEHRLRSIIRWNAMAIVLRANKHSSELGGHIASFQSSALLYDTGFTHFWHAPSQNHGGDLIYIQGHVAPGIYARSLRRRPAHRRAASEVPSRGRRQRALVLSASLAHAGLLAISDGLDGPWAADGNLSGPLSQIPSRARFRRYRRPQRSGRSSATAKWTSRNRPARSRSLREKSSTI